MARPPRRQFLAGLAAAGSAGIAGCPDGGGSTGTPTPTPTASVADLTYGAEVLEQLSAEAPASVRTMLLNHGDATVGVEARETVVLEFEYGPDRAVLLFPETPVGPNETPSGPAGGCWRYTDDGFLVRDVAELHEVDPEGAFTETYRVYTRGEERSCLPDGQYGFGATVRDGEVEEEDEAELELRVDVTIDGGHVSVSAFENRP